MDFVSKTLGLSIGGPFTTGAKIETDPEWPIIWDLFEGTVKKDGRACTLLVATTRSGLAENYLSMLRKLRLPGIIKYIDSYESGAGLTIAVEPIRPVANRLDAFSVDARKWGLQSVLKTLEDLHKHTKVAHCNVHLGSLFESSDGEWILGGLELAGFADDSAAPWARATALPKTMEPPEVRTAGWSLTGPRALSVDVFQFGQLVKQAGLAQGSLAGLVQETMQPRRPSLLRLSESKSVLLDTPLSRIAQWTANPYVVNDIELTQLLQLLSRCIDAVPLTFAGAKLLPELVKAVDNHKGGFDAVKLALAFSSRVEGEHFENVAVPYIIKLFASLDRAIRLELLESLPSYIDKMSDKVVQRSVLPAMSTGFADTEALIRRQSLVTVPYIAKRLTSRQLNADLLRMLAKTNSDPEPDIRASTIGLLSDLAELLDSHTRSSVIVTALARALRDSDASVRQKALAGLRQTSTHFSPKESAEKLIGPAATALLDSSPAVRRDAESVLQMLLTNIRSAAAKLDGKDPGPPASLPPTIPAALSSPSPGPVTSSAVSSTTNLATASFYKPEAPAVVSAVVVDDGWGWSDHESPPSSPLPSQLSSAAHIKQSTQVTKTALDPQDEDDADGWDW